MKNEITYHFWRESWKEDWGDMRMAAMGTLGESSCSGSTTSISVVASSSLAEPAK